MACEIASADISITKFGEPCADLVISRGSLATYRAFMNSKCPGDFSISIKNVGEHSFEIVDEPCAAVQICGLSLKATRIIVLQFRE